MSRETPGVRYAEIDRETKETKVHVVLDMDGGTKCDVETGIGFFDHMLHQLAFHGGIDLGVEVEGDLGVDDHHTVEDIGIALGRAIQSALAGSDSITRYGERHVPMDEALVHVALDVSGRGFLSCDLPFKRDRIGELATENVKEFFRALAVNAGITVHIRTVAGDNDHHICEAAFKAFGQALRQAVVPMERKGPTSTKGVIG